MALVTLAQALLDAAAAALTAPPVRQFVSHNAPAWEACAADQLTVHLLPLAFRQSNNRGRAQSQALPTLHIQIVRCVPGQGDNGPPSIVDLDASAKQLLTDLDEIQTAIRGDGSLFTACDSVTFGQATPLGPSGNVGGYDWPISASLL